MRTSTPSELAHALLLNLEEEPTDAPKEVETAWADEIDQRLEEIAAGQAELLDGDDVFSALRRKLRARQTR